MKTIGIIGNNSRLFGRYLKYIDKSSKHFITFGRANADYQIDLRNDINSIIYDGFSTNKNTETYIIFAGITKPDECSLEPALSNQVNVINMSKMISSLLDLGKQVIFLSSDAVYEKATDSVNETSPIQPQYIYGIQKSIIEQFFKSNPNFKIIRLSYVLCTDDILFNPELYLNGLPLYDNFFRSIIFENDVYEVLQKYEAAFGDMPKVLNVCGERCISKFTVGSEIAHKLGYQLPVKGVAQRSFFANRAKKIHMKSNLLQSILERPPLSIFDTLDFIDEGIK